MITGTEVERSTLMFALELLHQAVNDLEQTQSELTDRLAPVLQPPNAQDEGADPGPPAQIPCPAVAEVESVQRKVRLLREGIVGVLDRLAT
jgi:hypothetical protein